MYALNDSINQLFYLFRR